MPSCVGRSSDNLARALTEWLLYTVQVERTPIEDTPMLFSITREELGVNSTSPVFISPATNDHGLKAFRESRLRFEKYATKSLGCQDSNLKKKIWYNIFNMTGIWMEWNGIELTLLSDSTLSLSVSSQVSSSQGFPKSSSPSPSTSSSGWVSLIEIWLPLPLLLVSLWYMARASNKSITTIKRLPRNW